MAEDAVSCELFSAANSLQTGKNTGNALDIWDYDTICWRRIKQIAMSKRKRNREILPSQQGPTVNIQSRECLECSTLTRRKRIKIKDFYLSGILASWLRGYIRSAHSLCFSRQVGPTGTPFGSFVHAKRLGSLRLELPPHTIIHIGNVMHGWIVVSAYVPQGPLLCQPEPKIFRIMLLDSQNLRM